MTTKTYTIEEINKKISPFKVTEAGLIQMGVKPAFTDRFVPVYDREAIAQIEGQMQIRAIELYNEFSRTGK